MFIDYLKDTKAIDEIHYSTFSHALDLCIRDLLVEKKIVDNTTMSFLWGEYVGNNKGKEG